MMIRGVIFDLGNTLVRFVGEWDGVIARGTDEMCQYLTARGYPVPESFAENFRALREQGRVRGLKTDLEYTTQDALNDALTQHSICWIPEAVIPRAVEKFYESEAMNWYAYDDARATLEILKTQGLKLALMSNAMDHAFTERLVQMANLTEFFDPLVSSAQIAYRKPDPRAFQPILKAWQLPPQEIVMVGDDAGFDILGAHRAGMRGVLIENRWEHSHPPHTTFADAELMKPDAVIQELAELPEVIAGLNDDGQAQ